MPYDERNAPEKLKYGKRGPKKEPQIVWNSITGLSKSQDKVIVSIDSLKICDQW